MISHWQFGVIEKKKWHLMVFKFYCAGDDFLDPKINPIKNLNGKLKHNVLSELRFKKLFLAVRKFDVENEFG